MRQQAVTIKTNTTIEDLQSIQRKAARAIEYLADLDARANREVYVVTLNGKLARDGVFTTEIFAKSAAEKLLTKGSVADWIDISTDYAEAWVLAKRIVVTSDPGEIRVTCVRVQEPLSLNGDALPVFFTLTD